MSPSVQTATRARSRDIFFPQFSKVIVTPQKPFDEEQLYFGRTKVDNNSSSSEKNDAYSRHALSERARSVRDDHRVHFSSRRIKIGEREKERPRESLILGKERVSIGAESFSRLSLFKLSLCACVLQNERK